MKSNWYIIQDSILKRTYIKRILKNIKILKNIIFKNLNYLIIYYHDK